jgi:hypothetical protein
MPMIIIFFQAQKALTRERVRDCCALALQTSQFVLRADRHFCLAPNLLQLGCEWLQNHYSDLLLASICLILH